MKKLENVDITKGSVSYRNPMTGEQETSTVGVPDNNGEVLKKEVLTVLIDSYEAEKQDTNQYYKNVKDYRPDQEEEHQAALENFNKNKAPSAEEEVLNELEPDETPKPVDNKKVLKHFKAIKGAVRNLTREERIVIKERGKTKKTPRSQIARKINQSESTVMRLEKSAVAKVVRAVAGDVSDEELTIIFEQWSRR